MFPQEKTNVHKDYPPSCSHLSLHHLILSWPQQSFMDRLTREGVKDKPIWFLFTFTLPPSHNGYISNTQLLDINLFRTFFQILHFHLSSSGEEMTETGWKPSVNKTDFNLSLPWRCIISTMSEPIFCSLRHDTPHTH